jgi:PIN domain nuclease of toxin-antitoxin system
VARLLLDTHLLLWAAEGDANRSMPKDAATLIDDDGNTLLFSAASIWEVAIKSALGREDFRTDPRMLRRGLLDNGYVELTVTSEHAAAVAALPPLHKDPFDRLLAAQAGVEGLILLTADGNLAAYGGMVQRVGK